MLLPSRLCDGADIRKTRELQATVELDGIEAGVLKFIYARSVIAAHSWRRWSGWAA